MTKRTISLQPKAEGKRKTEQRTISLFLLSLALSLSFAPFLPLSVSIPPSLSLPLSLSLSPRALRHHSSTKTFPIQPTRIPRTKGAARQRPRNQTQQPRSPLNHPTDGQRATEARTRKTRHAERNPPCHDHAVKPLRSRQPQLARHAHASPCSGIPDPRPANILPLFLPRSTFRSAWRRRQRRRQRRNKQQPNDLTPNSRLKHNRRTTTDDGGDVGFDPEPPSVPKGHGRYWRGV